MGDYDAKGAFIRCLISFYGEERVARAPMVNHEELPRHLGRADEFFEEWERWKSIAKKNPASSEREEKRAAASKGVLSSFTTPARR